MSSPIKLVRHDPAFLLLQASVQALNLWTFLWILHIQAMTATNNVILAPLSQKWAITQCECYELKKTYHEDVIIKDEIIHEKKKYRNLRIKWLLGS